MVEIKAFVGHSFTKDDADVVAKFSQHFDRLSKILPNFSWVHAEAAEPKQLSEKVLSLIADRNVFVGICTKKERVVPDEEMHPIWYNSEYLKIEKSAALWKTSDWIIQEIGMAKARGLELILLLEDGIRRPGGLQGDVEYIPFERNAPEKSFDKILEMLTSLSPKIATAMSQSSAPEGAAESETKEDNSEHEPDWLTPKENWDREKFEMSLIRAILMDDTKAVEKIDKAYLARPEVSEGDNADTWRAHLEYYQIQYGKGGSLTRLKELAEKNQDSSSVLHYLARAFVKFGHHGEAADVFLKAALKTSDQEKRAILEGQAAYQSAKGGAIKKSDEIIFGLKSKFEKGEISEKRLLETLNDIAKLSKEDDVSVVVLERLVELNPDDYAARFSLAYKHSELGNQELALFHYEKIPFQERNAITWNNLGVSYDHFKLPAKSVDAYRQSEAEEETLAMSNLANKFLWAGFTKEAKELCDKAVKNPDYHKNVLDSLSRMKEMPGEESNKLEEVRLKMEPKIIFYREIGRAVAASEPSVIASNWQGPDCLLTATMVGKALLLKGEYERDAGGSLYAALGLGAKQVQKYKVEFTGNLHGRVIDGFIQRKPENATLAAASLLSIDGNKTKLLMILALDGTEIRVIEDPSSPNPTFYSLKKVVQAKPQTKLGEISA